MKKKARAVKRKPAFGPHPDDARELRAAVDEVARGELPSQKETYALLDEALGERFPRPTAKKHVKHRKAKPMSVGVDAAMEEKARREDLAELLAEMSAESGPPSSQDRAWARRVLGL